MADFNPFGLPQSKNSPPPFLTCWEALEALRARLNADWDHPSFIKAGIALPNLRDHFNAVLAITIEGEGSTGTPPDPLERFKGRPIEEAQLSLRVKGILINNGQVTTLYYLLKLSLADLDAISGIGPTYLAQIDAERKRLLAT